MKKIIVIIICFVIGVLVYNKSEEIIIPNDAIRIRIIANSNSIKDLYEKNKLKDNIKKELYELINQANSSIEANQIIEKNMDYIEKIVSSNSNNHQIKYGINHFPRKEYKGVIYPEGDYQSLVITLGSGLGDNWWCVLYPPICMINDNENIDDVEYRLFVSDIINT